ncbi:MAG: hypothetical protein MSIBF_05725 [Candidatus Altiarchaeales archaeon IMC4]|nr:MAG: hypothetical protein MSIBF_05725 [Candidatus Altiarchaeales archaeon IMC4]
MKPRVLITDKIHDKAIDAAREFADVDVDIGCCPENLIKKIRGFDALIVRSETKVTRNVIEAGKKLRVIGRAGVGLDNIDANAAKEKGVEIVNSPEASSISVAELVFGSMLAVMRKIVQADKSTRAGKWERSRFSGNELYGKTLGIIGFGRIGREVALRANAFGMNVLAYDPNITKDAARKLNAQYEPDLDNVFRKSDIITLHVPLIDSTKNMVNKKRLETMKENAVIVNIARGGIIDEKALYDALKNSTIAGAALDVFEKEPPAGSPLLTLDNIVLTQHLGASTDEAQINAGIVVVEKVRDLLGTNT